jgi:hypothetical protein
MLSQNALFVVESSGDYLFDHPPGAGIAQTLANGLRGQGFRPGSIDNWRDCGWSIDVSLGHADLQISLAPTVEPKLWMLQVSCFNQPGFLACFLGAKRLDCTMELFKLASAIHQASASAGYGEIRWCVDGYPDDGNNSPEPRQ